MRALSLAGLGALGAVTALALCGASGCAHSALFPNKVLGWRLTNQNFFDKATLIDYLDGGADAYLAYDFRRLQVGFYSAPQRPQVIAEAYDMGTSPDAYGALSVDPAGRPEDVGAAALYGAGILRFYKGRWFVRVLAQNETPETERAVLALGREIARRINEKSTLPPLLDLLPKHDLVPRSTTYFHTQVTLNQISFLSQHNLLGLGPDTDAVTAKYRLDQHTARLIIIRYPSDEKAWAAQRLFVTDYLKASNETGERCVELVKGKGFAGVRLAPPYLILVLEAPDAASADALLSRAAAKLPGQAGSGPGRLTLAGQLAQVTTARWR